MKPLANRDLAPILIGYLGPRFRCNRTFPVPDIQRLRPVHGEKAKLLTLVQRTTVIHHVATVRRRFYSIFSGTCAAFTQEKRERILMLDPRNLCRLMLFCASFFAATMQSGLGDEPPILSKKQEAVPSSDPAASRVSAEALCFINANPGHGSDQPDRPGVKASGDFALGSPRPGSVVRAGLEAGYVPGAGARGILGGVHIAFEQHRDQVDLMGRGYFSCNVINCTSGTLFGAHIPIGTRSSLDALGKAPLFAYNFDKKNGTATASLIGAHLDYRTQLSDIVAIKAYLEANLTKRLSNANGSQSGLGFLGLAGVQTILRINKNVSAFLDFNAEANAAKTLTKNPDGVAQSNDLRTLGITTGIGAIVAY